jgi:hypothetical protein
MEGKSEVSAEEADAFFLEENLGDFLILWLERIIRSKIGGRVVFSLLKRENF